MILGKDRLLGYGRSKGYYTDEEVKWCMQGNNIKKFIPEKKGFIGLLEGFAKQINAYLEKNKIYDSEVLKEDMPEPSVGYLEALFKK
jgi:hypothetical protein